MITATTSVVAVIGDPVEHSRSPAIHNAAFEALDLDWVYVAFGVKPPDLAAAIAGVRAMGLGGLSVTMPHKSAIVSLLDRLTPTADTLGAVNCVTREGAALVGHNTDGAGLVDCLAAAGFDPSGRRCLVLGAGGAARAATFALGAAGAAEVGVWARRPEAAGAAAVLAGAAGKVVPADGVGYDLVVNATPLGMAVEDPPPVPPESISAGQTVVDLVYAHGSTALLEAAERAGAAAIGGTGPLIHQAARSFELWTGQAPPVTVMGGALPEAQERSKMDR
ncbi:MAG: shikimate dehydrogenase [Actinobacteria bacterium]|nr:shikimate dehydrogenase [Actinomycetota bacterium]